MFGNKGTLLVLMRAGKAIDPVAALVTVLSTVQYLKKEVQYVRRSVATSAQRRIRCTCTKRTVGLCLWSVRWCGEAVLRHPLLTLVSGKFAVNMRHLDK